MIKWCAEMGSLFWIIWVGGLSVNTGTLIIGKQECETQRRRCGQVSERDLKNLLQTLKVEKGVVSRTWKRCENNLLESLEKEA